MSKQGQESKGEGATGQPTNFYNIYLHEFVGLFRRLLLLLLLLALQYLVELILSSEIPHIRPIPLHRTHSYNYKFSLQGMKKSQTTCDVHKRFSLKTWEQFATLKYRRRWKHSTKVYLTVNDYSSNDGYKWNNWSERKLKGKLMTLQCEPSGILWISSVNTLTPS